MALMRRFSSRPLFVPRIVRLLSSRIQSEGQHENSGNEGDKKKFAFTGKAKLMTFGAVGAIAIGLAPTGKLLLILKLILLAIT